MIFDSRMQFSAAQSIVGPAGTPINSTNVYDSSSVSRDLGNGRKLLLCVEVVAAILAGAAGSLLIQLVSSASASLTSPVIHASVTIPTNTTASQAAGTAAGAIAWELSFPPQGPTFLEYVGVIYTPTGQATTQGTVNTFTTLDKHGVPSYPTVANLV
jgi:hypothetical protein